MVQLLPFEPSHISSVIELWKRSEGVSIGVADSPEEISRYLDRNPGMSFVAVSEERVVGAILGGHDGRRGYLHHLAVDAGHRRLGIGQALVDRSLAALEKIGIERSHVFVQSDNEAGRVFWERAGWRQREDLIMYSFQQDWAKSKK